MNEVQIRESLRNAVGGARYPAYLSSRVEARLKGASRDRGLDHPQTPWLAVLERMSGAAAMLLVVLLIAVLVIGVHAWRSGDLNPRPAGEDPAVKQYQALVGVDRQTLVDAAYSCPSITIPQLCLPASANRSTAMQRWLDDLNRSRPPARFAAVDSLLRHHLAIALSGELAWAAGYRADDRQAVQMASTIANGEVDTVYSLADAIVASEPGTIVSYTSAVRADKAFLLACESCQQLLNQNQLSCQASQTPSCADEIAAVRLQVETFQGDLVFDLAPPSLAKPDARLQADLVAADRYLDSMEAALSGGDQVGLQAARDLLRQALGRIDSDAAEIIRIS